MILIASVIVIITFIAVINLVNIISTGIVNRRKETASLCALGMTRGQLFRMFVLEAVGYTASGGIAALIISLIATLLANSYVISQNWDVLLLFSYGSAVISSLLTSLGGFVIATVTIFVCLKAFSRGSIAEQMKVTE
jgi:putative ABC transport system permease protein